MRLSPRLPHLEGARITRGARGSRKGGLFGWETVVWCGDLVTVGGTGLVGGEGGVRWKESHRQELAGLDWRVAADWEAGAGYAGNSKGCGRSNTLPSARTRSNTKNNTLPI